MVKNPFLSSDFLIRWSAHDADHIEPAIRQALADAQAALDAISGLPLAEVTYANTFLALEQATEQLTFAWGKVTHLQAVADSPALRSAAHALLPDVTSFYARIPLNPALWRRLKAVAESAPGRRRTGIHRRLMDETVKDFREAGADLPPERRRRLERIRRDLAQLTQQYAENVLDATNAWEIVIDDESRLQGLPRHVRDTALRSAQSRGYGSAEKPAWRFTLHQPSQEPVMIYAQDETLRREVWTAAVAVGTAGEHDNRELVPQILALRDEEARLLGQDHFADHVLARRMAGSGRQAWEFVHDLQAKALGAFQRECAELERFKGEQVGTGGGKLKAWEVSYWAERQRRAWHGFDDEALRPYLPMDRVIAGLFELCHRIFGLRIAKQDVATSAVWHEEVAHYTIHDEADRHLGSFYTDWHPRESKRGGAWMGYLITGGPRADGVRLPHLGYICGNLTPPSENQPALLTHREAETVFHEFGHLLHHLLGEVAIKSLNGVNVALDFVELPSQIMENWCWERDSLDLFARHHETGEPIPVEIFDQMIAARNFRAGCAMIRQLQFAKMDLLLHIETEALVAAGAEKLEVRIAEAIADTMVPTIPPARPLLYRFSHLFSDATGYAAGYYSYKWAEALEADAFGRFREAGILDRKTGREFVDRLLSRGNSQDPAKLFRAFRGRDPDAAALLRRCGLLKDASA